MEYADPIEVVLILILAEMGEKIGKGVTGGQSPQLLFPIGDLSSHFRIGGKGVFKAGADVASINTGHERGARIFGKGGEGTGEECFGGRGGWRALSGYGGLKSATQDGENGKGAVWEK